MASTAACSVDLSSAATYFESLPHEAMAELRRTRPVFWHEGGSEGDFWAVLKHEDIRAVSRDNTTFSSAMRGVFYGDRRNALTDSLLLLDPPAHRQERRVVEPLFSRPAMAALEDWMRGKARELMAAAADRQTCDFVGDLAAKLPLAAISEMFGIPEAERAGFLQLGDDVVRSTDAASFTHSMGELGRFGLKLAAARTREEDDLVAVMLRNGGAPILEDQFGRRFAQIAVAANETTRTLLSGTVIELIGRPELYRELRKDPSLIPTAVEEFLRWVTPIYYMRRTATREVVLRDTSIRAGDAVVMYYLSGNYDEDEFASPFTLDIRRQPNRHLSFGVGRHVCVGQFLARLEARVFLEELVARFSAIELAGQPERLPSPTTNSWNSIPVALTAA